MRMVIFILTIFIIFSGCVEESKVDQLNESEHQGSVNIIPENLSSTALSSKEENIPEIEITSFSSIYKHDNNEKVYDYLFCWDNVPGNENQRLISYLLEEKNRNYLEISWGNHAHIIKSDDNKTIRVYFSNTPELMLEDNKGNVLRTPDVELKLREVNGKYEVLITPQTLLSIELEGKEVNGKLFIYKVNEANGYNITERYYAAYGLSIKNNGSKDLDFKLNELHVRDGDHAFNTTIEPSQSSFIEVLSDLEKETKLEDTTLSPGQTINGSVVFQVNSLYNKSFLLIYNETPVPSASFEKSIEALSTAERYNYSVIFSIPPYSYGYNSYAVDPDSFEPNLKEYSYIWANWVNRGIFEVFNKADIELFNKDISVYMSEPSKNFIPRTEFIYALRVIPERNISLMLERNIKAYPENQQTQFRRENGQIVVDDTGEELVNTSINPFLYKIAILKNQTYVPQMNFSNVTVIRISFKSDTCEALSGRLSSVNQNVIMDKELNIVAASNECRKYIS